MGKNLIKKKKKDIDSWNRRKDKKKNIKGWLRENMWRKGGENWKRKRNVDLIEKDLKEISWS